MPQGPVLPTNAILYAGTPLVQELEAEGTLILPGRLVMTGSDAHQCKVGTAAGALTILGVADIQHDHPLYESGQSTPDYATDYVAGDPVRVLRGDIVVMVVAKSGESIAVGDRLEAGDDGLVVEFATAGKMIGYALTAKSGDDNEWILAKLTI